MSDIIFRSVLTDSHLFIAPSNSSSLSHFRGDWEKHLSPHILPQYLGLIYSDYSYLMMLRWHFLQSLLVVEPISVNHK